jgi:hypothetical protein
MRTTEAEEDTHLTVGIVFSLDRCLLMGDPTLLPLSDLSFEICPFWRLFGFRFPAIENIVHHVEDTTGQPVP